MPPHAKSGREDRKKKNPPQALKKKKPQNAKEIQKQTQALKGLKSVNAKKVQTMAQIEKPYKRTGSSEFACSKRAFQHAARGITERMIQDNECNRLRWQSAAVLCLQTAAEAAAKGLNWYL